MPDADDSERRLQLILMGTGPFAVPSFAAILAGNDTVELVITRPEVPSKSRKQAAINPVRQWATDHDLPIYDPPSINADDAVMKLREVGADLLVVCDYGQILSSTALATAKLGGINLHGSLLPAYRGAAPVQWAVWNGDESTGVSVIHMTPRLDGGPVLASITEAIKGTETAGELEDRLSEIGVDATLTAIRTLRSWDGQQEIGVPQDASRVSKAPRLAKSDGQIDWSQSTHEIDCQIRAMQPWPGAFAIMDHGGKQPLRLTIREVSKVDDSPPLNANSGQIVIDQDRFLVVTGDGMLQVVRLVPAGKREMTAAEFLRGNSVKSGMIFKQE